MKRIAQVRYLCVLAVLCMQLLVSCTNRTIEKHNGTERSNDNGLSVRMEVDNGARITRNADVIPIRIIHENLGDKDIMLVPEYLYSCLDIVGNRSGINDMRLQGASYSVVMGFGMLNELVVLKRGDVHVESYGLQGKYLLQGDMKDGLRITSAELCFREGGLGEKHIDRNKHVNAWNGNVKCCLNLVIEDSTSPATPPPPPPLPPRGPSGPSGTDGDNAPAGEGK
ncbi:MAG: hypothetical protein V1809_10365 [Planctomycetota bacterium]